MSTTTSTTTNNQDNQPLPDPNDMSDTLNTTSQQFSSLIDDFQKYYTLYNSSPDSNENTQMYAGIKSNIQNMNSKLFSETNNIYFCRNQNPLMN